MTSFAGKRVLVIGLGLSGASAARALTRLDAKVRVTDSSVSPVLEDRAADLNALGVEVELGGHDLSQAFGDLAVVSPGIPLNTPLLEHLRSEGVPIWSEIELAYRLRPHTFLAVTGTNGKTTTTSLLAAMLIESGIRSAAAGNIGLPLVDAVFDVPQNGAIAAEVSSFQLATIDEFRPRVAVLLNIDEDHTDWHGSVDAYAEAKGRITVNQQAGDALVFNADDARCVAIAEKSRATLVPFSRNSAPENGIGIREGNVLWRGQKVFSVAEVPLSGTAGIEDAMAAAAAALEFGVDGRALLRALKAFRTPPHRLEVVAEAGGITFVDDSKATNPHAAVAAVGGLTDVVLIAGGRSKGIDLSRLADTVPPVLGVVAMGEATEEVVRVFGGLVPVVRATDMTTAVREAFKMSVPGGSVLLSPGCASLDMYESYAARGEDFGRAVRELLDAEGLARREDGIS